MPMYDEKTRAAMATPSADHYMQYYTDERLRCMLANPALYGVGERLDADAILRQRRDTREFYDAYRAGEE